MNWVECAKQNEFFNIRSRFEWPVGEGKGGFDCNETFTFNDIWGAISWVWTWPGDWIFSHPEVQKFFEWPAETVIGSSWSTALSWLIIIVIFVGLAE